MVYAITLWVSIRKPSVPAESRWPELQDRNSQTGRGTHVFVAISYVIAIGDLDGRDLKH